MTSLNIPRLEDLANLGVVDRGAAHFARMCSASERENRSILEAVIALTSKYLSEGHPCVTLSALANQPIEAAEGEAMGSLPPLAILEEALRGATCVQAHDGPSASAPLVLDERGRLYISRFFDHESVLAKQLAGLLVPASEEGAPASWISERLDVYFPSAGADDRQRAAAERALSAPLTVISGGPGTGKTSTVVKILALLFEKAEYEKARPPIVKLLAPTGKAAARMMETINAAREHLELPEQAFRHFGTASTIHRALGVIPGNPNRFRRGPDHPLRADIVLVDEASMIDLALMRHLTSALAPRARLILLGDRHQLASVEAGSVLSELSDVGGEPGRAFTVELTKSYRFADESGIGKLSRSIRSGDREMVRAALSGDADDLALCLGELDFTPRALPTPEFGTFRDLALARYGAAFQAGAPREVLRALNRFRVLCAHRRGKQGVVAANEAIIQSLVSAGCVPEPRKSNKPDAAFFRGRLVMVTENDYALQLFNGDVGLAWPDETGRLTVYFEGASGELRTLPPSRMPVHETAFALTVHKSQGSEHDEVAFVLPDPASPLLSRQLVYTAITRARRRVHLFGQQEALLRATEQSVARFSGLADRIREALMPQAPG